jgi:hypothetical protein
LIEPRGFKGRTARVLEPKFDIDITECFSGLGLRGPIEADKEAREDTLFSDGRDVNCGVLFAVGVVEEPKAERRFDGVPWTVANGGL